MSVNKVIVMANLRANPNILLCSLENAGVLSRADR